jgi:multicomponent K+:H+ antiporter subunit G
MTTDLPIWAALGVALLLLLGAGFTLTGSLGLLRLKTFYQRAHATTLGATFGTLFVSLASALYFSAAQMRPLVHEILIPIFVVVTMPVAFMLLVRAALFRDRVEGRVTDFKRP